MTPYKEEVHLMAKPYKQEKKAYKKAKRKHVTLWKTVALICAVLLIIMLLAAVLGLAFGSTRLTLQQVHIISKTSPTHW